MNFEIERNLGIQPIAKIMSDAGLKPHDLVSSSEKQITHKMITRACKGRRLTINTQIKVLNALNNATEKGYGLDELFNY
jgi:hypothetical protein